MLCNSNQPHINWLHKSYRNNELNFSTIIINPENIHQLNEIPPQTYAPDIERIQSLTNVLGSKERGVEAVTLRNVYF